MVSLENFLSQGEPVASLVRQIKAGKATHAVLLCGETGVGKWTLAKTLASLLLCEFPESEKRPCGKCRACLQMESLSHPDLIVIQKGIPLTPSEAKSVIPVSDILEMTRRVTLHGYEFNGHIVLIRRAEDMNEAAQNKLLKTLEEPPDNTYFLITCRNQDLLLSTIVSRCRVIRLHSWKDQDIKAVLQERGHPDDRIPEIIAEADGSIGKAISIAEDDHFWELRNRVLRDFLSCSQRSDIMKVASVWKEQKDQSDMVFSTLEFFICQIMRNSFSAKSYDKSQIPDRWLLFFQKAESKDFIRLLDAISLARKRVHFSINYQTVIEQLLLSLMEAINS